jgi:hypothetical protein
MSNHLYRKKNSKNVRLTSVLIIEKYQVVVSWVLAMQDVG